MEVNLFLERLENKSGSQAIPISATFPTIHKQKIYENPYNFFFSLDRETKSSKENSLTSIW